MHNYIIGQSRTGKSTLLLDLILKDIEAGNGVFVGDPHGTLIDDVLGQFPKRRLKDVILLDPSDIQHPVAWNPFYDVPPDSRPLLARAIVTTMHDIHDFGGTPTTDLDLAVYSTARAMLDTQDGTVLGMVHMILDKLYRNKGVAQLKDPLIRRYFQYFEGYKDKEQMDKERSTLTKLMLLLGDPYVRNVLGQPVSSFKLSDVLETNKCLFVRLPQGTLGVEGTKAVGSLLLTSLHHQALRRKSRQPFGVHLDECHTFGAHTIAEMLSGIGKFGVELTLAHQYLSQLPDKLKASVLGNVSKRYVFRVGIQDSVELQETLPFNNTKDEPHEIARFKARVFSDGQELPNVEIFPIGQPQPFDDILRHSRTMYATKQRKHVEGHIEKFLQPAVQPKKRASRKG